MKADEHTPGPWNYMFEETAMQEFRGYSIADADGLVMIAPENNTLNEADARLIAAAPDLLAALREIAAMEQEPVKPDGRTCIEVARSAIAKAKGQEKP